MITFYVHYIISVTIFQSSYNNIKNISYNCLYPYKHLIWLHFIYKILFLIHFVKVSETGNKFEKKKILYHRNKKCTTILIILYTLYGHNSQDTSNFRRFLEYLKIYFCGLWRISTLYLWTVISPVGQLERIQKIILFGITLWNNMHEMIYHYGLPVYKYMLQYMYILVQD